MRNYVNNSALLRKIAVIGAILAGSILLACACGGDNDNPVEPPPLPTVNQFTATPSDIMPGDSALITYETSHASSVALHPGAISLTPVAAGEYWVHPAVPTDYQLRAANSSGADSATLTITMAGAVPSIERFVLSESGIMAGDSTVLDWKTVRTDQIVFDNGLGSSTADSGQIVLHPTATTTYTAIASNSIGTDTASVEVLIEEASSIFTLNGRHYLGTIGSNVISPQLRFQVLDADNNALQKPWMHFSLVEGDGTLATDSAQPGATRYIVPDFTFSGDLGHAILRGSVTGVAPVDVDLRASVIIPGAGGQGQYIRFVDSYGDVKKYNGPPARVDVPDDHWTNYAVYEAALGVVIGIDDSDQDEVADDNELVVVIILNSVFSARTAEGIGIGSSISAIRATYGVPDSDYLDTENSPPAQLLKYDNLGLTLFCDPAVGPDSMLIEMHLWEPAPPVSSAKLRSNDVIKAATETEPGQSYRRSYRRQAKQGAAAGTIH